MEALFEEALVEVDEQRQAKLHEFEIGQDLSGADGMKFLHRLYLAQNSA